MFKVWGKQDTSSVFPSSSHFTLLFAQSVDIISSPPAILLVAEELSQWSLPVWCWWSWSKAIHCCKFLARGKHFAVDVDLPAQTSHPWPREQLRDWPSESGQLLTSCYGGKFFFVFFYSAHIFSVWVTDGVVRSPAAFPPPPVLWFLWGTLEGSRNMSHVASPFPPVLVLILHSGQNGLQAPRLIMIDSEITELILE